MLETFFNIANWIIYCIGIIATMKVLAIAYSSFKAITTRLNAAWSEKYGKGSWAVITGCTEGIGKAFCFQLAQLGFKLVLISRSEQKLEKLSHQLWEQYPQLGLIIIVTNFSGYSQKMYEDIYGKISHIDISILVNNVGTAYLKKFHSHSTKEIDELININIKSMTHLTSKILPHMLERKLKSAIINLSSHSIHCPFKDLSVYTATKAYNDLFSRCLTEEYSQKIDVISSRPCIVSTAGTKNIQDSTACSATQCARGTLKALGKCKTTAGHWTHIFQSQMANIFGETASRWIGNMKLDQIQASKKQS